MARLSAMLIQPYEKSCLANNADESHRAKQYESSKSMASTPRGNKENRRNAYAGVEQTRRAYAGNRAPGTNGGEATTRLAEKNQSELDDVSMETTHSGERG